MEHCIFCKIAAGQIPASVVFENERLLAFKDIRPAAPVHVLIIPKKHIDSLSHASGADQALLGEMLAAVPELARNLGCAPVTGADGELTGGYKTQINTGPDGGQEVYHLHVHLMGGPHPWRGQR